MSLLLISLLHGSGMMNPPVYRLHGAACAEDVDAMAIDPAAPLSFSGFKSGTTSCRACGEDGTVTGHLWRVEPSQLSLEVQGQDGRVGTWQDAGELCGPAPRARFSGTLKPSTEYEILVQGVPAVRFRTLP